MKRETVLCAVIVFLLALLAMGWCVRNDFVKWDDPQTIAENPDLRPPTLQHALGYWISPAAGLYVPVTYTAWSLIARITDHPWAFHLVSSIAHAIASLLAFGVLRRLVKSDPAALLGALLFAVHPLQVEAVAWASGLKDVLAGLFALAAIYLHIKDRRTPATMVLSSIFFALAMLAKPSAASAVLIAMAIDFLVLRRSMLPLIPWLVIALPLLVVARHVQDVSWVAPVDWWKRPLVATDAIAFYLYKLLVPFHLAIDYGRLPRVVLATTWTKLGWIVPVILGIAIFVARKRLLTCAAIIFLAGLIWNLGLSPFQFQIHSTVADHYMYLAMLGPALVIAWLVSKWPRVAMPTFSVVIAAMLVLSIRQVTFWQDSQTLFEHSLAVHEHSYVIHYNLGRVLGEANDLPGAESHFQRAIEIDPTVPEAHRNLAVAAVKLGDVNTAIAHMKENIRLSEAEHQNVVADRQELVRWLVSEDRWGEIAEQLERALAADPNNPKIVELLAIARQRAATQPSP